MHAGFADTKRVEHGPASPSSLLQRVWFCFAIKVHLLPPHLLVCPDAFAELACAAVSPLVQPGVAINSNTLPLILPNMGLL